MERWVVLKLKEWAFKAYRFVVFGFKKVRPRTTNQIFIKPERAKCDYCSSKVLCVQLEGEYGVLFNICELCARTIQRTFALLDDYKTNATYPPRN